MKKLFYLLPCLLVLACSSGDQGSKSDVTTEESASEAPAMAEAPATAETPEIQDMVVELATRNVKCGCAIEEIGHCGNYVEINSQYVELANSEDVGLGGMEWCGKSGVKVETAGEIKNGKFVASVLTTK